MTDISTNGHVERPEEGREEGSAFSYTAGDLVFNNMIPGLSDDVGLVYEYRTPSVLQMYEMLDHDGKARSLEQCLLMPIIGANWRLEGKDQKIEEWADEILRRSTLEGGMRTPMIDVIAQKAEALVLRVAYHEKVWKSTSDGKIVYDKIAWRPPDTCTLLRNKYNGDLEGYAQWVYGPSDKERTDQIPIRFPYADVYIHGQQRDPVRGLSDLTVTYHNYRIKEKLKFLWYTYCEVLSLPRQIVLGNSKENAMKVAQAIAGLKNASVAGIAAEWVANDPDHIKEISVAGSGATDFQDAIGYLDSDSALSLLAGFTDLPARAMGSGTSHGPQGSYALAESSQSFFTDMEKSYAAELSAQVTNSLIADLVRYNHGVQSHVPRFILDLDQEHLQKAFGLLQSMLTAPNLNVPFEFVRQLVMTIAKNLGMDQAAIQNALDVQKQQLQAAASTPQEAARAPVAAAANVGAAVAQQAQGQLGQ